MGEDYLQLLDQAGQSELADRLFAQASGFYFDILEKYPDSPLHLNNFAWFSVTSIRHLKFSKGHAEKAVEERPNNSSYLDTLAEICFQTGEINRAVELIEKCIQINPVKPHYQQQARKFRNSR